MMDAHERRILPLFLRIPVSPLYPIENSVANGRLLVLVLIVARLWCFPVLPGSLS